MRIIAILVVSVIFVVGFHPGQQSHCLGQSVAPERDPTSVAWVLKQELQNSTLRRLAIDRYRLVRRIEQAVGDPLSFVHGWGSEAIFPAGRADVVFWLTLDGDRQRVPGADGSVRCFHIAHDRLITGPRGNVELIDNIGSSHPSSLFAFLQMRGCVFARNADRLLLRELKGTRAFVGYKYDGVGEFLSVETLTRENVYQITIDAENGDRFARPQDFFQKYGLPPSEAEVRAKAMTVLHAKPSVRRP